MVPARHFEEWLSEIPPSDDAEAVVPVVWSTLRDRVRVVEAKRAETEGPPRAPLLQRLIRSFVWPVVAVASALYLTAFTAGGPWPLTPIELVTAIAAGVVARRRWPAVRPAVHAWLVTNIALLLLWIGLAVINLLR